MRLLLALAVVALALVAWLAFTPRRAVLHDVRTETAHESTDSAQESTTLDVASETVAPRRAPEGTSTRTVAKASSEVCRLRGRVVDEFGTGISGARVQLREWGSFPEVLAKHETTTGRSGGFELEFPVPTSPKQSLVCSAEPFHAASERWFGMTAVGVVQMLVAGDVDAGDVVLPVCGVVEGRVITPDAMPVEGVWVRLLCDGRTPTGANTDASGRYSVANVLPGRWIVTITDDDWTAPPKTVVDVEFNRVTQVSDLAIERLPTIEGIVVEADGRPVSNISVIASRTPQHAVAWDTSLPDGTFKLKVRVSEPLLLSVDAQRDFMAVACAPGDKDCTFEPGARGVRIVLQRAPRMTFRIVDAATGARIEQFGIKLTPRKRATAELQRPNREFPTTQHANGEIDLPVPNESIAEVEASGYARTRVAVEPDAATSNVQTIALLRGSSITGRVMVGGKPAANARLWFRESISVEKPPIDRKTGKQFESGAVLGVSKNASANDRGEFAISNLAAGTYVLDVEADGGGHRRMRDLVVPVAGELALGDIELARESIVKGVVRTASGDSPVGFMIAVDGSRTTVLTEDGAFEFSKLQAGAHWLEWWRGPSRLVTHRVEFRLAVGETREIVIDAPSTQPCTVRVRVRRNGMPAANVSVTARSTTENTERTAVIGRTDAHGNVVGRVEGGVNVVIAAESNYKRLLGVASAPIDTVPGGDVSCEIDIRVGTLVLELPAAIAVPEHGRVTLAFAKGSTHTALSVGGPPRGPLEASWSTNRIDFGEVPAGSDNLEVRIERYESGVEAGGRWIALREPWLTTIQIEEGQETRAVVP